MRRSAALVAFVVLFSAGGVSLATVVANTPDVDPAGAFATLTPKGIPVLTSCAGEDPPDTYNQLVGTWSGLATDQDPGLIDFPPDGTMKVKLTFIERTSGLAPFLGTGVAFGNATLTSSIKPTYRISGQFKMVTYRDDTQAVTGRGFWDARIMGAPGAETGHSLWANFEIAIAPTSNNIFVRFGGPFGPAPGANDLSAEYDNQVCP